MALMPPGMHALPLDIHATPKWILRDAVNERVVRILLECILVFSQFDPCHKCTRSVSGSFQFRNNCTVHVKLFTNEKVGKNLIFKNSYRIH